MSYRFDFHEDVATDYSDAYVWYESKKEGLGERFLAIVKEKLEQIGKNPEAFSEKTKKGYREAAVDIFPYLIVYKLYKRKKIIFVNSIHHQKQHPRKKYRK